MSPLPDLVVIGAMKCGTTSLHRYLDAHPDIAMSRPKELNFFIGRPDRDTTAPSFEHGNWHLGAAWYRAQFPPGAALRGEASPGYTSPSYPEVAERMARLLPEATLVYLVREPLERAVSQYQHHRRDGAEPRPIETALLDPDSQYVARSRYAERLAPFLAHYPLARIHVIEQAELRADPAGTVRRLYAALGVDDRYVPEGLGRRWNAASRRASVPPRLRAAFHAAVRDDVVRLRELTGLALDDWPG